MTDEQINIAIAESLGFTRDEISDCWRKDGACFFIEDPHHLRQLPNYASDLNACHEFEKTLDTAMLQNKYYAEIADMTWGCEETGNRQVVFNQLCATARQRCKAYLITIGKWKE